MSNLLDNERIDIPCPHCGQQSKQTIARLKRDPDITCPSCRQTFHIEAAQLRQALQTLQRGLDNIVRGLGKR